MKLYYSPGSCSLAPHIVLEEIGNPYETELVSAMDGSTKSAEYLKINPKARVPALDIGSQILTEAPAILVYLALSNPDAKLLDESPHQITKAIEWMNWLSSGVHALPVAQNWRVERFSDDENSYPGIRHKGMQNLHDSYQMIEDRMSAAGDRYALGDRYSIVDPYLLVFYRWGNRLGLDMEKRNPNWTRHTRALLERPAVVNVLEAEDISVWK